MGRGYQLGKGLFAADDGGIGNTSSSTVFFISEAIFTYNECGV